MTTRPLRVSVIAVGNSLLGLVGMLWALVAGIVTVTTSWGPFEPRVLADACYPMALGVLWALLRLIVAAAQVASGIGLYAMRPWARPLAVGVACFWLFALLMSAVATPVSLVGIQFSSTHVWVLVAVALLIQLLLRGAWSAFTLWTLLDREIVEAFEPGHASGDDVFRPITASVLAPQLVPLSPHEAAAIAAGIPTAGYHAAPPVVGNPVEFVLSGPNLPAWQPSGEGRRNRTWKVMALAALAMVGLLLMVASLAFGSPGKTFFAAVMLAGGLFCLGSVWFERQRFFDSRRARGMRWMLGEAGARKFYLGLGTTFVLLSYVMSGGGLVGGLLFLALVPVPKVSEPDLPGKFDFYLPPRSDPMERWKATKSETSPLPPGARVLQPKEVWRGGSALRLAALDDDQLLLLREQQQPRLWRRGKEKGVLFEPSRGGMNVSYSVSAGSKQIVALQQHWNEPQKLRRLVLRTDDPQQPAVEQSWENIQRPGEGWLVEHIKSVAVSDDGQTVAFADNHLRVFVWNAVSAAPEKLPVQATDDAKLALSPDGRLLLIGEKSGRVRLVELAEARAIYTAAVQGESVEASFSPDGQSFYSLHEYNGRNAAQIWRLDEAGAVQHQHNLGNYSARPMGAWSPDGRWIAVYGRHSDMIQVFGLASGKETLRLTYRDGVQATAICFSADSRQVIADGGKMMQWQLPGAD